MADQGRRVEIQGIVQGVGFRPWVYRLAHEEGVTGTVRNDGRGVTIEAFGSETALDRFLERLEKEPPAAAVIDGMSWDLLVVEDADEFVILPSRDTAERRVSIPPDLATCEDCLREIWNPADRRYRYPFTNCTNCGPRFTIVREVPYDRPKTTMAPFPMCPDCQREYETVEDRRFHAQPNACPVCGPKMQLLSANGHPLDVNDPIARAAEALREGLIVAVKGLGGFHLACDATSSEAVKRLRERKRRDQKPFAVMVRTIDEAAERAWLGPEERRLLTSVQRPVVLVIRRDECDITGSVAPANPYVGMMLAYTPLHHLLIDDVQRPLVMTSGNLSEEPIAYLNTDAVERMGDIADFYLVHDREIETRCDDSVARVIAGRTVLFRRSRGFVPRGVIVTEPFARPVLACGGHLKNTFCFGVGDAAYLGPHIGDLENLETFQSYEEAIDRMERFLKVRPEVIAYDLHPNYLSTVYARQRNDALLVPVQHHHAHIASVMGEHGLVGPVIGVAYDGTGYGTDGTAWGGEILIATLEQFNRIATFRPIPLAGGDKAIKEVWRIALALLDDAFGDDLPLDTLELFQTTSEREVNVVRQMIKQRLNTPMAHGVGRYFDGIGSLVLVRPEAYFEGQVAMEWDFAADCDEGSRYRYSIDFETDPWTVDLRMMTRGVVADLVDGQSKAIMSAKFHNTLIAATVELARSARARYGEAPVVLTGGCFQNARLVEGLLKQLTPNFTVYVHGQIPPGDGGIALGQALIADAVSRMDQ